MTTDTDATHVFTCRRSLEALRNGVPNREAVKILGCHQPRAERRFTELLSRCSNFDHPPSGSLGMLVSGDFGSGKSHLLSYLEHQALSQGFVCSRVTISKETPLYNLDWVFRSAVYDGRMPDRTGQLMEELGLRLANSEAYSRFYAWANSKANGLHAMFPATLMVHERSADLDLSHEITAFWAGERIKVSRVRNGLRAIGQLQNYTFTAPTMRELPPQRLRFATELIKGAGYKGWVVLLDEIELIGSYSLLQRARAYAELARWLGKTPGEEYPGLVVVGAVTDDFAASVLGADGKKDRDYVGPRLRARGDDTVAARAEMGMRCLEREPIELQPSTEEDVNTTVAKLQQIYSVAYGWEAPSIEATTRGAGYQRRMRYRVRAAINEWDLRRLVPNARPQTEGTDYRPSYNEDPALAREGGDEEQAGGV